MPDLTGLPALDVAIGLSFIFLLLSLFATAVQETISGILNLRGQSLEQGLRKTLGDGLVDEGTPPAAGADPAANTTQGVLDHPVITSFRKEKLIGEGLRKPSYISPRSFALVLLDTLAPQAQQPDGNGQIPESHDVVAAVRSSVDESALPAEVKTRLLTLIDQARGDLNAVHQGIEEWFDDTMARVSGWYKRKAQIVIIFIAIGVTVLLNANTIAMGEVLWKDPAVRAAVVAQATSDSVTEATPGTTPKEKLDNAANSVDEVAKLGVPLGGLSDVTFSDGGDWVRNLGGWLLTIVAISLGAPFWFDTLSRLSRLRNSGKPETPLPASGRGLPNERIVTPPPAVNPTVETPQVPAAPPAGG